MYTVQGSVQYSVYYFIHYRVANSFRYSLQGQGWVCSSDKMYFQGALIPCKSEYYSVHYSVQNSVQYTVQCIFRYIICAWGVQTLIRLQLAKHERLNMCWYFQNVGTKTHKN